ncbi:MAG: Unknown protein [uncultured Sulfurovum sp.]|uniref:Nitrogen regulatory protein P-II n=1 Tax=uncultured Sulfurovum sp. TaxID=269237 RepID=A0A6S6T100_9BACT|nr:MAG: Unknown protein [uncultured Sulfurovum sp.]
MSIEMCTGKSIQIIINSTFENKLIQILKKNGLTGYTQLSARGDGTSGVQDGHSEGESNVMFIVLASDSATRSLLEELNKYRKMGYHIFVYTHQAEVLNSDKIENICK